MASTSMSDAVKSKRVAAGWSKIFACKQEQESSTLIAHFHVTQPGIDDFAVHDHCIGRRLST